MKLKEDQRRAMFGRLGKGPRRTSKTPLAQIKTAKPADGKGHAERIQTALKASGLPVERVYRKPGTDANWLHVALVGQKVPRDKQGILVVASSQHKANEELRRKATEELVKIRTTPGEVVPKILVEVIERNE